MIRKSFAYSREKKQHAEAMVKYHMPLLCSISITPSRTSPAMSRALSWGRDATTLMC
jgi:hypothetical protein